MSTIKEKLLVLTDLMMSPSEQKFIIISPFEGGEGGEDEDVGGGRGMKRQRNPMKMPLLTCVQDHSERLIKRLQRH